VLKVNTYIAGGLLKLNRYFFLCLLGSVLACSSYGYAGSSEYYSQRELQWFGNGTVLLYGRDEAQQWLLNTRTFKISKLPYSTKEFQIAVSESGENIAIYDRHGIRFGPIKGPLSQVVAIPVWLGAPQDTDKSADEYWIYNEEVQLVWVSKNKILVNQRNRETGEAACKIYSTESSRWENIAIPCIESDYNINKLQYSQSQKQMVIYSSVEGAPMVNMIHWDMATETKDSGFPDFDLLYGVLYVHFLKSPIRYGLTTPCQLDHKKADDKRPCEGDDIFSQPWRYYVWDSTKKTLHLEFSQIPPYAVPNPDNDEEFVWQDQGKVCIGNPMQKKSKCLQIP